jgi:F1F0 ATPase subunit 2
MTEFDTRAVLLGLALGLPASALYFAGLAWGLRRALQARRPALELLLSFMARAALLLGLALWLVQQVQPLWALGAYALAFVLVRTVAVRRARAGIGALRQREGQGACN